MYGYRPAEQGLILTATEVPDLSFKVTGIRAGFYDMSKRKTVRVSLGCHVESVSLPVPDLNHGPSILAGLTKRVAARMPPINRVILRRFKRFVKRFCNSHLRDLKFSPDEQFSFEDWIANAPYTAYRKADLTNCYQLSKSRKVLFMLKCFVKNENYPDFKHLRGIFSRHDDYKVRTGPFFQLFGEKLFKTKWFIKKITNSERPHALLDKLEHFAQIYCTDFSQYEATFVSSLLKIEAWVYRWCLEGHPRQKEICDLIALLSGTNKMIFKDFNCRVEAKRMSGEMNTSCGNGLMNLLLTFFILEQCGNDLTKIDAFFEGDDGIIGCQFLPTVAHYTAMGANIKIEIPDSIATASFCGNVFAPAAMHNVTNPREASVAFGWTDSTKYRFAGDDMRSKLLCSKSLSMMYEYPGCPILASLGRYGLRMTNKYVKTINREFLLTHSANSYEAELNLKAAEFIAEYGVPVVQIHPDTRLLVEKLYGISIAQQLDVEYYLDHLTSIKPLDIDLSFPRSWYKNDLDYTVETARNAPDPFFSKQGYITPAFTEPSVCKYFRH